jgi:hypothetical protein
MDALWATDYELDIPLKWKMAPFNDDWMSSIFASFDPLAIESVGYDFLRTEFTVQRGAGTYVQMSGTDDYLHQAADSANWPVGIRYDPENDGTVIASLGTHEHWNDGVNKQYSRNLGTGNGIELLKADQLVAVEETPGPIPRQFILHQNYPNPFNASTVIRYELSAAGYVTLKVFDLAGREVKTLVDAYQKEGLYRAHLDASNLASGTYHYRLTIEHSVREGKMILIK